MQTDVKLTIKFHNINRNTQKLKKVQQNELKSLPILHQAIVAMLNRWRETSLQHR